VVIFPTASARDFAISARQNLARAAAAPVETAAVLQDFHAQALRQTAVEEQLSRASLRRAMTQQLSQVPTAESVKVCPTGMLRSAFAGGVLVGIPAVGGLAAPVIFAVRDGQEPQRLTPEPSSPRDPQVSVTLRDDLDGFSVTRHAAGVSRMRGEYLVRLDEQGQLWKSYQQEASKVSLTTVSRDDKTVFLHTHDQMSPDSLEFIADGRTSPNAHYTVISHLRAGFPQTLAQGILSP
jgi:hypothetical protein